MLNTLTLCENFVKVNCYRVLSEKLQFYPYVQFLVRIAMFFKYECKICAYYNKKKSYQI